MPSSIMDQGYGLTAATSSFFSEELRFPTEKHVGYWRPDSLADEHRIEGAASLSGNKPVSSSPVNKLHVQGAIGVDKMELPQQYILNDEKTRYNLEHLVIGSGRLTDPSTWRAVNRCSMITSDGYRQHLSSQGHMHVNGSSYMNGLSSSLMPDMVKKKLSFSYDPLTESIGHANFDGDEPFESTEEIEAQTIGNLLPNDDELLSGVTDNIGYDIDDDIFYNSGGIEMETDGNSNKNTFSGLLFEDPNCEQGKINDALADEYPFGEHPSRTLFVRNINSSVEDAELKALFEQYGDIRTLYTACKHRGFVMISYFDIRSARNAMRALQNKPLRHRKLDIHYSIPKENPSEKDINQGTLVVFSQDSTVSNDELLQIFGVYGEIKEIRETPRMRQHKFIEFYDIRAAESALALNGSDIDGKKIKIEPSWPGGARRSLIQQISAEMEQEELNGSNHDSSITNPQSDYFVASNGLESGATKSFQSIAREPLTSLMDATFLGISSGVSQSLSSPIRTSPVGNHGDQPSSSELGHPLGQMNFGYQGMTSFYPNSFPEYHDGAIDGIIPHKSNTMSALGTGIIRPSETVDSRHIRKTSSSDSLKSSAFDHNGGAFGLSGNGSCSLHGHQYSWNSTNSLQHQVWSNSPSFMNDMVANPHGFPRAPSHMLNTTLPLHHHTGSAPGANRTLWDRRHTYHHDATDPSVFNPGSLGSMPFPGNPQLHQLELASRNIFPHTNSNSLDHPISPARVGIPSPQQKGQGFHGRNHLSPIIGSYDCSPDRIRSRRNDSNSNQSDNKKQYELDIDQIVRGEDSRTTLMIKNIPNKYSAKMLLAAIDENHRGTYDFIYLPIDFKNKCNVGYAFINMTSPDHIVPFYQTFNGKKWEKFNSEKVASLAYARIQGKPALIAHFQNSSLMNEDKRCRPILFHSEGPNAGDQEPFPLGTNIRSRPGRSRTSNGNEDQHQESPFPSPHGDSPNNALEPASGSTKD